MWQPLELKRGFTLLEILIALAIFAILAMLSLSALTSVIDSRRSSDANAERLSERQMALAIFERDLSQLAPRATREASGELAAPFQGNVGQLSFTRGGFLNPLQETTQSDLTRVSYVGGSGLQRQIWPVLDAAPGTQGQTRALLTAESVQFTYFDAQRGAHPSWPPEETTETEETPALFPTAIRLHINLGAEGILERYVAISAQPPSAEEGAS